MNLQFSISDIPKLIGVSIVASDQENLNISYLCLYRYLKRDIKCNYGKVLIDDTISANQQLEASVATQFDNALSVEDNIIAATETINAIPITTPVVTTPKPISTTFDIAAAIDAIASTEVIEKPTTTVTRHQENPEETIKSLFEQFSTNITNAFRRNCLAANSFYTDIAKQIAKQHSDNISTTTSIQHTVTEIDAREHVAEVIQTAVAKQNGIAEEQTAYTWLGENNINIITKQKHLQYTIEFKVYSTTILCKLVGVADGITADSVVEIKNRMNKIKTTAPPYESLQCRLYMKALGVPYSTNPAILVQGLKQKDKPTHFTMLKIKATEKQYADDEQKITDFARRYAIFISSKDHCDTLLGITSTESRKEFLTRCGILATQKMLRNQSNAATLTKSLSNVVTGSSPDSSKTICIFDVETHNSLVVEFAYILMKSDHTVIEKGTHLVKRPDHATYKPNGLNNITAEMLASGLTVDISAEIIKNVFGRADSLCGYNCRSDLTCILKSYTIALNKPYICVYTYLKEKIMPVSLASLYEAVCPGQTAQDHRALGDCEILYSCARELSSKYPDLYQYTKEYNVSIDTD